MAKMKNQTITPAKYLTSTMKINPTNRAIPADPRIAEYEVYKS